MGEKFWGEIVIIVIILSYFLDTQPWKNDIK